MMGVRRSRPKSAEPDHGVIDSGLENRLGKETLDGCFWCGKHVVKLGILYAEPFPTPTDVEQIPGTPSHLWRYMHKECFLKAGVIEDDPNIRFTSLPRTLEAWLTLELRILDDPQMGGRWLWGLTNWRYVVWCVLNDDIPKMNQYDPEPVVPKRRRIIKRRKR